MPKPVQRIVSWLVTFGFYATLIAFFAAAFGFGGVGVAFTLGDSTLLFIMIPIAGGSGLAFLLLGALTIIAAVAVIVFTDIDPIY